MNPTNLGSDSKHFLREILFYILNQGSGKIGKPLGIITNAPSPSFPHLCTIKSNKDFFTFKTSAMLLKKITAALTPTSANHELSCPNCWGHTEWHGEYRPTHFNLDKGNCGEVRGRNGFIRRFVRKYLPGNRA